MVSSQGAERTHDEVASPFLASHGPAGAVAFVELRREDTLSVLATLTLESSALPGPLRLPLEIFGTFLPGSEQFKQAQFVTSGQP